MFPSFVSSDFEKLVKLYSEINEIMESNEIVLALKSASCSLYLPEYFLNYLRIVKMLKEEEISEIKKICSKNKKSFKVEPNDFVF